MAADLPPRLSPREIEPDRYRSWLDGGYFRQSPSRVLEDGVEPYAMVIPPPNVTATLHMGHGLNATVQDVLIRWMRMRGRAALWVPGTDHAGIATQNVVERRLARVGMDRACLGRERFVEEVWSFVNETAPRILGQLRAVGASCDWERTRFTLDDDLSKAVRQVFVHLHSKGLVYRGEYIVNWCPRCRTALSNEEAEGMEVVGRLWHLRYPFAADSFAAAETAARAGASVGRLPDGRWHLAVSTTRPETMLGDTGVAVHPDDDRCAALVGANVELPLADRRIPVVADSHVDPEFGSGMVKLTPAHDPNDFEIAQRTGVASVTVIAEDGRMAEDAPEPFRGMDRLDARKAVVESLAAMGLVAGSDSHTHAVPHCYRCATVIEPRVSPQWFVRMKPLAEPALRASREGRVTFTPERWQRVYEHWLENIRDWCISRQLWWGHRIPVWSCRRCGDEIVELEDPTVCPSCGSDELGQDPDMLDTWFSSQLWPFSVFGWPERTPDLQAFYPGHALVTAPEILFFWVARMIMMGLEFQGEVPFREVYLHGTVRDAKGRKMSKSLGNGIDPLEVVDKHGADAMRYTLVSQCAIGADIHLDHTDVEAAFAGGRNFANKIWNAGRFAVGALGDSPLPRPQEVAGRLRTEDRWIISKAGRTAGSASRALERYRLHEVAETLYHFFRDDLCDWYLELVKGRLQGVGPEREAGRTTLFEVLDVSLRLLHPLMPFVTAEVWSHLQRIPRPGRREAPPDLMVADWPDHGSLPRDRRAERRMDALVKTMAFARRVRQECRVPAGAPLTIHLWDDEGWLASLLKDEPERLMRMARVGEVVVHDNLAGDPEAEASGRSADAFAMGPGAHAFLAGFDLFIPLAGVIDLAEERRRLERELAGLEARLRAARARLADDRFVGRAPPEVVDRERARLAELEAAARAAGLRKQWLEEKRERR